MRDAAPAPQDDNPLQLLRDAIDCLKLSSGELPDQAQLANLIVEAQEALERANVIARAVAQCEDSLREARFDQALEALDAGLLVYPADPALVTRRRAVEERQKAFHSAAAVRKAIEEAQWFVDQDRIDLALHVLKDKAAELPAQPALISRLEELGLLLPGWERKRYVETALGRAAALEQLEQRQAALTILEEALQFYPASQELIGAAQGVRDRSLDHERKKRLARRLELIGQKIAAQSWRQALTLVEEVRAEFPGAPELNPLQAEVEAGLSRSECEAVVAEVRQWLADGELEQAKQVLCRGLESLGPEPALEALRSELESVRRYREELRTAQILFGRRRLQEAERILEQLVAPDRPEAQALLNAVREARAAAEEENFCERGREKALELIQTGQFAQAADLLRNLLALDPGNPILEKDLIAAQSGLDRGASEVDPAAGNENPDLQPAATSTAQPAPQPMIRAGSANAVAVRVKSLLRFRRTAITGACVLVLVSAAGAAWKLARNGAPVRKPAVAQFPAEKLFPAAQNTATPVIAPSSAAQQELSPQPSAHQPLAAESTAASKGRTQIQPLPAAAPRRFIPEGPKTNRVESQEAPLPPPPAATIASVQRPPVLPEVLQLANVPAPSPAPPPVPAASTPASTVKPAAPPEGGRFLAAQIAEGSMPDYPALARQVKAVGVVRLEALIDEHGAVKDVKVLSGHPILAAAARNAVVKWKYKPATLDGQPIASKVVVQISFGDGSK